MKMRMFIGLHFLIVAACLSLRAADNPAQAAARIVLEEKLHELETPPVQPAAAPSGTVMPTADNPAQAAARLALEQKLHELETPPVYPPAAARPETVLPTAAAPAATNLTNTFPATIAAPPTVVPVAAASSAVAVKTAPLVAVAPASFPPAALPARKPAMATVAFVKPTDNIVTIYGTLYKNAEVEKVESDGVIISYWMDDGGFAVTKIDFKALPPKLQKQYQKQYHK